MAEEKREVKVIISMIYHDHVDVYERILGGPKKLIRTETPEEHKARTKGELNESE